MDSYLEDGNGSIRGHSFESPYLSRPVFESDGGLHDFSPPIDGHTGTFQNSLSHYPEFGTSNLENSFMTSNFDILPLLNQEITSSQPLPSLSSDYGDPLGYEDLSGLSPRLQEFHAHRTPVVLDLTNTPTAQASKQSGKRSAGSPTCERSAKSARSGNSLDTLTNSNNFCEEEINVVDLHEFETAAQWEERKAREAADAVHAQNIEEATKPTRLSNFQCIICMDSPTDLAITHCGHLFCLECLHQALITGEKSCCPVCRSIVNLPKPQGRPVKNGVFLLEMKLHAASKKGKETLKRI